MKIIAYKLDGTFEIFDSVMDTVKAVVGQIVGLEIKKDGCTSSFLREVETFSKDELEIELYHLLSIS